MGAKNRDRVQLKKKNKTKNLEHKELYLIIQAQNMP